MVRKKGGKPSGCVFFCNTHRPTNHLLGGNMLRKFFTLFLISTFCISAVAISGTRNERKLKVPSVLKLESNEIAGPTIKAAQALAPIKSIMTGDPSVGVVIGSADYDYGWNSGWSRTIAEFNNGADIHMTYMERDNTLASPDNRRAQVYVYYNSASSDMVKAYPRPKATGATGFGGVDVISTGEGAGIAVMVYHAPNFFAIDGGPGLGQFTESPMATFDLENFAQTDPEISWDSTRSMLWYYDTYNRGDYAIAKSADFGQSWDFVDTLLQYAPKGQIQGGLDNPVVVAPNGNLYLATTITGTGSIPPSGESEVDSSDQIGVFKSTDGGAHWAWEPWGHDGDQLVVGTDTVYTQYENFGQLTLAAGDDNVLHMVVNGYCIKVINDSTSANYFYTLYRNSNMNSWKVISNPSDSRLEDFDTYAYTGNAIGFAYPTITVGGSSVFAAWSQPIVSGGHVDTVAGGLIQYTLHYSYSNNGGVTWNSTQELPNSVGALFTVAANHLTTDGDTKTAHLLYLADTARGNNVFDGDGPVLTPYIYRTVSFSGVNSVSDNNLTPKKYELAQNYPNPFNPATTISYTLPTAQKAALKIYNMLGQEVATLVNEYQTEGAHFVHFDASRFASGVYLYKLETSSFSQVKKMSLIK